MMHPLPSTQTPQPEILQALQPETIDPNPQGPCAQIVYTVAPKYLYGDYFKANVYTIWVHGPLG